MTCFTKPFYGIRLPTGGDPNFITSTKPFMRRHEARMATTGTRDRNHLGSVSGKSSPKRTAEIKRVSRRRKSDRLMGKHKLTDDITANILFLLSCRFAIFVASYMRFAQINSLVLKESEAKHQLRAE